jgi:hypothetical protein
VKKLILFLLLTALSYGAFCKHIIITPIAINNIGSNLKAYVGRYQSIEKRGTMTVDVALAEGKLVATASWDGSKLTFRHLNGDNFIVVGQDWSVKFNRDKQNQIKEMVVAGATTFTKVKTQK